MCIFIVQALLLATACSTTFLPQIDFSSISYWIDLIRIIMHSSENQFKLEMWANAQRDGRPAKYRWRPLFNAAKFGWRPLLDAVQ